MADVNSVFVAALFAATSTQSAKEAESKTVPDFAAQTPQTMRPYRAAAGFLSKIARWPGVDRAQVAFDLHEAMKADTGTAPPFNARVAVEVYVAIRQAFAGR